MNEFKPNIITITEEEFKRLFSNGKGMARSDKRKEKELPVEPKPIEPNAPEPISIEAIRRFLLQ